jgi:glycosyltransferase involved in cell wall biosynthesis
MSVARGNVAAVSFDYYPFDVRVRRLAEAAADAGYAMDVICLRKRGESRREVYNGVRIYRVPQDRGFGKALPLTVLSWCWFMLLAGATLTWLHLRRHYRVVHVHNMPDFLVFAALLPKLLGAMVILDVQDVSPELMSAKASGRKRALLKRLAAAQEGIAARFANLVVTVGWPFEELLLQRGVPQKKLVSILNSADPKLFPPSRRTPVSHGAGEPFVVMYWGTVAERNGLDVAVRAVALARERVPAMRLDIMGRGEHIPALKRLAAELGVSEQVGFSEPVPAEQIVDFVLHGDVGIIPYQIDGFQELVLPTKAYELAWMQRPIVASNTPAIRSMFRAESVALCEPARPEGFAEALVELYEHPERRERMVASAAQDYAPYRWELMSERYVQVLDSLGAGMVVPRFADTFIR